MERRMVAVLFTDLVARGHVDALREVVDAGNPEMAKTLDDGVMAIFALATAAVDCAVAAQRRFSAGEEGLSAPGLRAGIAVGEAAVVGDDYTGGPVPEAAR